MSIQHVCCSSFPPTCPPRTARPSASASRRGRQRSAASAGCGSGATLTGARTAGYHYLLLTEFDDEAALRRYATHPVHRAFVDWVHGQGSSELAFDYHLTADTALVGD